MARVVRLSVQPSKVICFQVGSKHGAKQTQHQYGGRGKWYRGLHRYDNNAAHFQMLFCAVLSLSFVRSSSHLGIHQGFLNK